MGTYIFNFYLLVSVGFCSFPFYIQFYVISHCWLNAFYNHRFVGSYSVDHIMDCVGWDPRRISSSTNGNPNSSLKTVLRWWSLPQTDSFNILYFLIYCIYFFNFFEHLSICQLFTISTPLSPVESGFCSAKVYFYYSPDWSQIPRPSGVEIIYQFDCFFLQFFISILSLRIFIY